MIIVKMGGGESINIKGIIEGLAELKESLVIVHGANALRDRLASQLKYTPKVLTSISGYSSVFSDGQLIDLQMMAYAGLSNKRIVELCHQNGIKAVGLSGLDGQLLQGKRNNGIRVRENGKTRIIRDLSGKPLHLNVSLLDLLMEAGYTPVISIPILDEYHQAVNSENDDIIALIHSSRQADKIFQFIEAPGLLDDPLDENSLIPVLYPQQLENIEKNATGRFKRKIRGIQKIFSQGKTTIFIGDGRGQNPVEYILQGKGTRIHAL
ncbi:MAG: [LysW]-aminoadipate kinase [Candidatus Aminicenantes bacterium]|nr:[LysW]-aminoadipate kinase [Candidatus Aminicenantes bacterium]